MRTAGLTDFFRVKVGNLSHGGKSRQPQAGADHDFDSDTTLTPFGILLPETGDSHLWFSEGKITADFMADSLAQMLPKWQQTRRFSELVINADNGPENSGRRTQWLKRLVDLADEHQITIKLAYYPPYHSKYNPVERLWGVLENHWRGELLDSVEKTLGLARTMSYKGIKPSVKKVTRCYKSGISLTKKVMRRLEARLDRTEGLESWFITIRPIADFG
jgi:transposase